MASIADNSTALQVMSEANADFLSLILNLRAFLNGKEPVTFTVGGQEITVNSLLKVIDDYRSGNFEQITLGGQDSETRITLSVNANGDLSITDIHGNLATLTCEKLSTSTLDKCRVNEVTANGATINSAEGTVNVRGGNFSFSQLKLNNLDVGVLNAGGITAKDMQVNGRVTCTDMFVTGTRRFTPQYVRNVFYRNNAPINNAANLLNITNQVWDMSSGLNPGDFGFVKYNASNFAAGFVVPDLIKICGNTKYSSFTSGSLFSTAMLRVPNNVNAEVTFEGTTSSTTIDLNGTNFVFAALMLWPTGIFVDSGEGSLRLCTFADSDIGKEVYYQVLENPWKIYRSMTLNYSSPTEIVPSSVVFGDLTDLQAYSCRRFIVNRHTITDDTSKKVVYALE